jgi:hypothetical protein
MSQQIVGLNFFRQSTVITSQPRFEHSLEIDEVPQNNSRHFGIYDASVLVRGLLIGVLVIFGVMSLQVEVAAGLPAPRITGTFIQTIAAQVVAARHGV